jgi:hypothetical protein
MFGESGYDDPDKASLIAADSVGGGRAEREELASLKWQTYWRALGGTENYSVELVAQ